MKEVVNKILISVVGVVFLIVACYFTICFVSYTPVDVYSTQEVDIFNNGGRVGSAIANFFLQYFGLSAILIPFHFLSWGLVLFYRNRMNYSSIKVMFLLLNIFSFTFVLSAIPSIQNIFPFLLGGYCGYMFHSFLKNNIFFIPIYLTFLVITPISVIFSSSILDLCIPVKLKMFIINAIKQIFIQSQTIKESIKDIKNNTAQNFNNQKQNKVEKIENPQRKLQDSKNISVPIKQNTKGYIPPEISFLAKNSQNNLQKQQINTKHAQRIQEKLKQVLIDFGIEGEIISFSIGPVITMYEFEPKPGIRSSRIIGLADDIARSLKAKSARISLIPNRSSLAIEVPNDEREIVYLRELIESESYNDSKHALPLCLGKDIAGNPIVVDLAKMPHLLVAGTTGSGKSIGINSMIMSILYKLSPDDCKLIMIDPKMLELSVYEGIPHLMTPVVTDPQKAALTLQWVTKEMEKRYKIMSKIGVRNIINYNLFIKENSDKNPINSPHYENETNDYDGKKMPYIIVIVDEMADLMLTAGKTVEASIQRLAQMARAAGIHIIMATQRPSVDVITGIIKANFPTRISFQVTSKIDSRTILGYQGAESLLGMGDMLYMPTGGKTYRIHGPFVDDKEVAKVVTYLQQNYPNTNPDYGKILKEIDASTNNNDASEDGSEGENMNDNDLYSQAVAIVRNEKKASISYIQRRFRIGYNKAANFIERMEDEGIVSAPDGQGKRMVLDGK